MNDEFLPIGSVVLLKDATRPVIIIGYMVVERDSDKIWDYLGCAYPIGVIDINKNLMFQRNQINKVLHVGYSDNEGKQFINDLKESLEQINNG